MLSRLRRQGDHQHPGGIEWWLRRIVEDDFEAHVWYAGGELAAYALDDAGYVLLRSARPDLIARGALLDWAEARLRARAREAIEVSVAADDRAATDELAARGYAPTGTESVELVRDLDAAPTEVMLPAGYRMATLETVDDDAYVALHRSAWSTHAPSRYRRALHDVVTAMPDFRRDMVPVVVAPDGSLAAYCIGWLDAASGGAEIEPLGTDPAHRRRGLATAVVHEIGRRARERGARSIMVWGSHANAIAIHTYVSAGHARRRVVRDYRKPLART
jgi:ribosomal protein S18 acetylase RimI-like enzyme